ncbi:MAG: ABC transporter substrate-binding protein [Trueperaceae bacterium]|nr:ABC transporter substrate-binding protein [Trueperaceae bacterium]
MRTKLITLVATLALLASASAQSTITVAIPSGPPGFDPQNNNQAVASGVYINIFDYLIFKDAQGEFQPALATSWEAVSDTAWRVSLREGVTWHDGEPFTADDVEFTFERVANDPLLVRNSYYSNITDVEVVNDHEVIFHTAEPDPIFLSALSRNGASVIPRHYYESAGVEAASLTPIGTGPYRFVEYRTDDRLVLEAFDNYWGGRPAFDRAVFRIIPENSTAVSELLTGGVDIVTTVNVSEVGRIEASTAADIAVVGGNRTDYLTFNVSEDQVTADPLVRAAVDYAVDDALLAEILTDGAGVPVRARVSPETSFSPLEYYDTYLFDQERARELLAEAGYAPGELTLKLMGATSNADAADLVAAMLADVGVQADIELFEKSVWNSRYWQPGDFTNIAFGASSDSSFDYGNSLIDLTCPDGVHAKRSHWCNQAFTDLVEAANVEFDATIRAGLLKQATDIILEQRPQYYLYSGATFVGVRKGLNFVPRADSLIVLAETTTTP